MHCLILLIFVLVAVEGANRGSKVSALHQFLSQGGNFLWSYESAWHTASVHTASHFYIHTSFASPTFLTPIADFLLPGHKISGKLWLTESWLSEWHQSVFWPHWLFAGHQVWAFRWNPKGHGDNFGRGDDSLTVKSLVLLYSTTQNAGQQEFAFRSQPKWHENNTGTCDRHPAPTHSPLFTGRMTAQEFHQ